MLRGTHRSGGGGGCLVKETRRVVPQNEGTAAVPRVS